ncbi:MAG: sigma-70 family RNA polymerase sigma factor [Clostridiales bacterium]|nr:sigma-70 family RNA polymerase sigma factor [Clostridiales bacterium]
MALSDEELSLMAQEGDQDAMSSLLDKYKQLVRIVAHKYFIAGSDRDDTIQEGMIGLYTAVLNYRSDKNNSFKNFAGMVIKRRVISALKSALRLKHNPLNDYVPMNNDSQGETTDMEVDPEQIYFKKESLEELRDKVLEKLSSYERKIFNLYMLGESIAEISHEMRKSYKSIDNAIQRIKLKLH